MKLVLVFSMIWIVLMFLVLPFGLKVTKKTETGFAEGAPDIHYIGYKLLGTAIVSIVLTAIYWYIILYTR